MRAILGNALLLVLVASPVAAQARTSQRIDLTGTWALTVMSEGESGSSEVTLVQRGDSLIGRHTSKSLGELEVVGSVNGREFLFQYHYNLGNGGQPLTVTVKGVVESADSLRGTATMGPLGSATFTAKRQRGARYRRVT